MSWFIPGIADGNGSQLMENVAENYIPVKKGSVFESSALSHDTVNDEIVSSIPFRAPAGTIYIGPQLGLDDAGGTLIYSHLYDGTKRLCLSVGFDDTGTVEEPFTTNFTPKQIRVVEQSDDSAEISGTSLIKSADASSNQFVSKLYFKIGTFAPADDIIISHYINSVASDNFFGSETIEAGTLSAGEEFSIALVPPLGALEGQTRITTFESASIFSLQSNAAQNAVWFASDLQEGTFSDLMDIEDYKQRQLIRSGIKENFSVTSINADTQIQLTADSGNGSFTVYFNNELDTDSREGFEVSVADQVITPPLDPAARAYFVSVDNTGTLNTTTTKTAIGDLTRVHLFSYTAINGDIIPVSLLANPWISWTDRTYQGVLETDGSRINKFGLASRNNADLSIRSDAFTMIANSGNYTFSKNNPHSRPFPAFDPLAWTYLTQIVTTPPTVGTETLLDPTQWDNGGTLTSVPAGHSTVQLVLITRVGQPVIIYGQETFANYDDAVLNARSVEYTLSPGLFDAVEVARIAMKSSATESENENEVSIIITTGGGGGGFGQLPELTTFNDGDFELFNAADNSKKAVFNLADVPIGTTNTYWLPEIAGTLATERPVINITSGTSITIDAPKYNQDTVYYISSPNNFTVYFADEAAKTNARITVIKAMDRRLTFQSIGAVTINGEAAGFQFDRFQTDKVFEFVQSNTTVGKTWTFDPGDKEQDIAYCKFNPQGVATGQEVTYRNSGRGFRVFKAGTGRFRIENDGTVLNDLRSNWATSGASGSRGIISMGYFIFGISGCTVNVYTWSSANGTVTGEPGTVGIEITDSTGTPTDVANANGHIYIAYKEIS